MANGAHSKVANYDEVGNKEALITLQQDERDEKGK